MSSANPATGNKSKEDTAVPKTPSFRHLLIIVFATCHTMKMLVGILPEANRPDPLPFGLAHAYEMLTGSQQYWNMFLTIPSHHAYRARIVITDAAGKERRLGPLLPGFQAYPAPEQARVFLLFYRMFSGPADELRKTYLRRVDHALHDEQRILPNENWCLEVEEDFTRHLVHVQRDGRLAERVIRRYSLTAPDGVPYIP